jgi:hypothetical protein
MHYSGELVGGDHDALLASVVTEIKVNPCRHDDSSSLEWRGGYMLLLSARHRFDGTGQLGIPKRLVRSRARRKVIEVLVLAARAPTLAMETATANNG